MLYLKVGRNKEVIVWFGDAIMNCIDIFGDTYRTRHDRIKQYVMSEVLLSGVLWIVKCMDNSQIFSVHL